MPQAVNLRTGVPPHLRFADRETINAHEAKTTALRASQVVPYAVAPGCVVDTATGALLTEGQEITLDHLNYSDGRQPWQTMGRLVFEGRVLKADSLHG